MAKTRGPVGSGKAGPGGAGSGSDKNGQRKPPLPGGGRVSSPWLPSDAEMEALGAELERGWQLVESGSLAEARQLAQQLIERYPEAPEVLVLLGMLDSLDGEVDAALARYEQASELDPEYVEPLLCAAELYIWELGEDEKGLLLCARAQEVAEEEEEFLDALLLQAEAEINLEREPEALETLRQLPEIELPEPRYHIRAGRLLLDLEEVEEAAQHFTRALEMDPASSDGMHGLGLCAEQRGEHEPMVSYFQKVRELDLKDERPPWALDEKRFREVCAAAIDDLPDELRQRLANVPILASDYPNEELVRDGSDPRLLGLFTGVPYGEHSSVGGAPHLETIMLFQRNIERMAYGPDDVENEIQVTLVHEAGHFFGLSEEQLEAMGLG